MLIFQGAEAKLFKGEWNETDCIIKQRFPKTYRDPALDHSLRTKRTLQEAKSLIKLHRLGIPVPLVYFLDLKNTTIYMEHVTGKMVKDTKMDGAKIGRGLASIHNLDIIHGDLTTSNMIERDGEIVWIDFGLSFTSTLVEDKAVDLYVLERSISSTHPQETTLMDDILTEYAKHTKHVIERYHQVRSRGRKRLAFG